MKSFVMKNWKGIVGGCIGLGLGVGICTLTGHPRWGKLKLLPA